jgi:hypothetical protein
VVDLNLRQIDTHHPRKGIGRGERNQIAAGRAPDLQYACAGNAWRVQSEDMRNGREMPRSRLRECV